MAVNGQSNKCSAIINYIVFLMGQSRPLFFRLFWVFSSKNYNFHNKFMWKNVHPVYGAGIRTHDLPITTRPGLPPINYNVND